MQKKIAVIVGVLILAGALGLLYDAFLGPEGIEGEKEVTVQIIVEKEDINETFTLVTEHEFLYELLEEEEERLGASFQSHDMGVMVTGMMDYEPGENEFFHIAINDQAAEVGIQEIPLQDGKDYLFELTEF